MTYVNFFFKVGHRSRSGSQVKFFLYAWKALVTRNLHAKYKGSLKQFKLWPMLKLSKKKIFKVGHSSRSQVKIFCMSGKPLSQETYMPNIKALSQTVLKLWPLDVKVVQPTNKPTNRQGKNNMSRHHYLGHKRSDRVYYHQQTVYTRIKLFLASHLCRLWLALGSQPWGIPNVTGIQSDSSPFKITFCLCPDKKSSSHLRRVPSKLYPFHLPKYRASGNILQQYCGNTPAILPQYILAVLPQYCCNTGFLMQISFWQYCRNDPF